MKHAKRKAWQESRQKQYDDLRKQNKIPTGDKRPGTSSCKKG